MNRALGIAIGLLLGLGAFALSATLIFWALVTFAPPVKAGQALNGLQVPGIWGTGSVTTGRTPARLLLAANHNQVNTTTFTASAANLVRAETRTRHTTGNNDLYELRLVYSGWYLTNGSGVQADVANGVPFSVAVEWPGAPTVTVRVTFGGLSPATLASGETAMVSDPVLPSQFGLARFPRNTQFWIRRQSDVTLGQVYGRHESSTVTDERTAYSDGLSPSQLMGTGIMSVPAGGADSGAVQGPQAILGRAIGAADISVMSVSDSIGTGSNDASVGGDGSNGGGYLARAAFSTGGRAIPLIKVSVGGAQLVNHVANTKWRTFLPWVTHGFIAGGTNDMRIANRPAATVWADTLSIAASMKAAGMRRVEVALILPRVTSTDSFATVVNQTPVTNFETGGTYRSAYNALAIAGGANIDNYLDVTTPVQDAVQTDRWQATITNDGVHPVAAGHIAIQTPMAARMATW